MDPKYLVQGSEYLETHLVAVPNGLCKDFFKTYETICERVVPRSAIKVTSDDEYTLYTVTVFKRNGAEFVHKSREKKWVPRDFKHIEGGKEAERKELERVEREERKLWGEAFRLAGTSWGESLMIWIHALTLRVFVETVLRYGLPLSFVCGLVKASVLHPLPSASVLTPIYRRLRN